jgi:hypothetical protein
MDTRQLYTLLSEATTTRSGASTELRFNNGGQAIVQAILEGTSGTVTATVQLYGSNDPICQSNQTNAAAQLIATFSLSGTGAGLDGAGARADSAVASVYAPYRWFWGKVTAISGTGASVYLQAGT